MVDVKTLTNDVKNVHDGSPSERNGFSQFHGYVCAAFLRMWSKNLQAEKDFQVPILQVLFEKRFRVSVNAAVKMN
ncbi:unnamed protein product [Gongylonema pulchrum]|uniref:DNA-directed RNA polymerase n=1 Tax=Gongylonema pulchrum TaxID=637853 RepID=A0A183ELW0_9BILA|nr:unnamed protein product [Gongylonema pulchrum]